MMVSIPLSTFVAALLLFMIEPMVARMALPSFGGTASMWAVMLAFFQCMLLAGYGYAYMLNRWLSVKAQLVTQATLACVSAGLLPMHVSRKLWKGRCCGMTFGSLM